MQLLQVWKNHLFYAAARVEAKDVELNIHNEGDFGSSECAPVFQRGEERDGHGTAPQSRPALGASKPVSLRWMCFIALLLRTFPRRGLYGPSARPRA